MKVMSYLRSTTNKAAAAAGATSPTAAKKKKGNKKDDAGLRESLLEQPAAAEEEGGVPKGYFAVYAGGEESSSSRRFVVPTGYLREPAFRDLMERAADEFGFTQAGGLRVPCAEEYLDDLLRRLHRKNNAGGGKGKKALR